MFDESPDDVAAGSLVGTGPALGVGHKTRRKYGDPGGVIGETVRTRLVYQVSPFTTPGRSARILASCADERRLDPGVS
jgi:hypothetical protein